MSEDLPAGARKPRRQVTSTSTEKRLLTEVLDLKDQVHNLVVSMERFTNMHASNQMIAQRDIAQLVDRVNGLEVWQGVIDTERSEQRGAARVRKSLLAAIAAAASIAGAVVAAFLNWLFKQL